MSFEQIRYEKQDTIGLLTLNRPEKLNAWTQQMMDEMVAAVRDANADDGVGAIVVTGAGRGFCAGADVKVAFQTNLEARAAAGSAEPAAYDSGSINWVEVVRTAKPMIAAVNGVAVGVGLTMILPFDVIIASDQARMGAFFVKMGLVPELASSYFLTQRVGFAHASEMCLTGRLYAADEAGRIGLVNRVVPHDELLREALDTARAIAANPAPQLRWIKGLLSRNGTDPDYNAVMQREHEILLRCYDTPEHAEAVRAFQEKRPPNFHALSAVHS